MYLCGFFVSAAVNVTDGVLSRGRNIVPNTVYDEHWLLIWYKQKTVCIVLAVPASRSSHAAGHSAGSASERPSPAVRSKAEAHTHTTGVSRQLWTVVPSFQHVCLCILPCSLCPPIAATALLAVLWVTWPVMGATVCWHWTLGRFSRSLVSWAGQFLIQDHCEFLGRF